VQFKRTEQAPLVDELVLEKERHVYTEAYIALVRDFYLRM
jgi:tRNA1Val (adenine37-N6)-methyltransferase